LVKPLQRIYLDAISPEKTYFEVTPSLLGTEEDVSYLKTQIASGGVVDISKFGGKIQQCHSTEIEGARFIEFNENKKATISLIKGISDYLAANRSYKCNMAIDPFYKEISIQIPLKRLITERFASLAGGRRKTRKHLKKYKKKNGKKSV
jgi:hypothetical protein